MPLALGHQVRSAVQALFDLQHIPTGEAVFTASVTTEPHQFR